MKNIYLLGEKALPYRYSPKDSFPAYNPYALCDFSNTNPGTTEFARRTGQVVYFGIRPSLITRRRSERASPYFPLAGRRRMSTAAEKLLVCCYMR